MGAPVYLALARTGTTLDLTDPTKFNLPQPGWSPGIVLNAKGSRANEVLVVDVVGAGNSIIEQAAACRRNLDALIEMLQYVDFGQQYSAIGPVTLLYTSGNSAPARVWSAQVTRWDPTECLPEDYHQQIATLGKVKGIRIAIERRHPWVLSSFTYPQLISGSAWTTNPVWAGTAAFTNASFTGVYGSTKYAAVTSGIDLIAATAWSLSSNCGFSCTSGTPITFSFTYGATGGSSVRNLKINLRDSGSATSRSGALVTLATALSTTALTSGVRFTVTLTPTSTATLYPVFTFDIDSGGTFQVAEWLAVTGSSIQDVWHTTYTEYTFAASATAANPNVGVITWPGPALKTKSPTDTWVLPYASNHATRAGEGVLLATSGTITLQDLPQAAAAGAFTTPAGTNAVGGTVLRYTPAGTTQVEMPVDVSISATAISVWATIQNNSATTVFSVQLAVRSASGAYRLYGPKTRIEAQAAAAPHIYNLGEMYISPRLTFLELWIEASAAAGTIDFGTLAIAEIRDDFAAIQHGATDTTGLTSTPVAVASTSGWLTLPAARLEAINSDLSDARPATSADDPLLWTIGSTMRVCWLGVSATSWTIADNALATVNTTVTVTRYPASDSPL